MLTCKSSSTCKDSNFNKLEEVLQAEVDLEVTMLGVAVVGEAVVLHSVVVAIQALTSDCPLKWKEVRSSSLRSLAA
jgi:hypothetical protein